MIMEPYLCRRILRPHHTEQEQLKEVFISFNHCPTKRQFFWNEGKGEECPASRGINKMKGHESEV
jgi:hypothetical protein